ncbi:hypothetical protein EYV94_02150 [Puteibacter caeruleilacunae]|nr:hypothetical protein EYV94_02150 [Puteibacter caeruleilacunae]
MEKEFKKGTYGYDLDVMSKHVDVVELTDGNARVALVPAYQGRVMTSSAEGAEGFSFGWINHDLIKSGEVQEHMNAFGGEERLWLGPEGGQFSIYFKKGSKFEFSDWFVPKEIDTEGFDIIAKTDKSVSFVKTFKLENYSGTKFDIKINRAVNLLDKNVLAEKLSCDMEKVQAVAYESVNTLTNVGDNNWTKENGLLSIWMLGMLTPSPGVTVVIPVKEGDEAKLGPQVNDDYFGKISADRLKVEDNTVFFKCDGKSRGKLGIPPLRAKRFLGSYDELNNILTLLECELPEGESDYVNSAWELQDNPYGGDAINSYNDGPLEDGSQMGPFYELESSSPAAKLAAGEKIDHVQRTYHLTGDKAELDAIAKAKLGVSLDQIISMF